MCFVTNGHLTRDRARDGAIITHYKLPGTQQTVHKSMRSLLIDWELMLWSVELNTLTQLSVQAWLALMSSSNDLGVTFKCWALSSKLGDMFPEVILKLHLKPIDETDPYLILTWPSPDLDLNLSLTIQFKCDICGDDNPSPQSLLLLDNNTWYNVQITSPISWLVPASSQPGGQRAVLINLLQLCPIRGQYSGHVICLDQSQPSMIWSPSSGSGSICWAFRDIASIPDNESRLSGVSVTIPESSLGERRGSWIRVELPAVMRKSSYVYIRIM